ncbi:MAG TPA: hypothetical protein VNO26_11120 [Candidatus Limnocylindria bacterium]|nr:hypothetical protein [Candidatus Limnocylindria bacterium]
MRFLLGQVLAERLLLDRVSPSKARPAVAVLMLALLVGAPAVGARAATIEQAGACVNCHLSQTAPLLETGGHAAVVDCQSCHADRRPGQVGNNHRSIPRCTDCHDEAGHPPRTKARGRRAEIRNCSRCHDVHGSTNAVLVRTTMRVRRRFIPMRFDSVAGAAPGGFTNPEAPGTGLCEVCHRTTRYYRADGSGESHFTAPCADCHDHHAGFQVATGPDSCPLCHEAEAARFALPSGHSSTFECTGCHAEIEPTPGPGHRAISPCAACHDNATHAPGGAALPCAQCHEPHGTANLALVREELETTQETRVPIRFDSLAGQADGSFASLSAPGSGICEVCHTTTAFYRADGSGPAGHFTLSCLPCHRHSDGFAPR